MVTQGCQIWNWGKDPARAVRMNSALSAHLPEKRVFIQSGGSTRYLRFTPLTQLAAGAAGLLLVAWMAIATATVTRNRTKAARYNPQRMIERSQPEPALETERAMEGKAVSAPSQRSKTLSLSRPRSRGWRC